MRRLRIVGLGALLVWMVPGAALAQTLEGRVVDGTFVLSVPGPGSYYVRVEKLSYQALVDGIFEFEERGGKLPVTVYLQRTPLELESIDVRVERANIRRARDRVMGSTIGYVQRRWSRSRSTVAAPRSPSSSMSTNRAPSSAARSSSGPGRDDEARGAVGILTPDPGAPGR